MLVSTDAGGKELETERQSRAQFSLWAVMASPLIISGNVRNLSAMNLATYKNAEVIAVNQDVLGIQGKRLVGGPVTGQAYLSACNEGQLAQRFERGSGEKEHFIIAPAIGNSSAVCFMARGCQSDPLFAPCVVGGSPTCGGNVSAAHPDQSYTFDEHTGQMISWMDGNTTGASWGRAGHRGCMGVGIFPYLALDACAPAADVPTAQQWVFSASATQAGSIRLSGSELCLTRGGLSTTNIWGR
jgi:hypothetical protein